MNTHNFVQTGLAKTLLGILLLLMPILNADAQTLSPAEFEIAVRRFAQLVHERTDIVLSGKATNPIPKIDAEIEKLTPYFETANEEKIQVLTKVYESVMGDSLLEIRTRMLIVQHVVQRWIEKGFESDSMKKFVDHVLVNESDPAVRWAALYYIVKHPELHVNALRIVINDPESRVRSYASVLLAKVKDERAIPLLLESAKHPDPLIVYDLCWGILGNSKASGNQKLLALQRLVDSLKIREEGTSPAILFLQQVTGNSFGIYWPDVEGERFRPFPGADSRLGDPKENQIIIDKWRKWYADNKGRLRWSDRHKKFVLAPESLPGKAEVNTIITETVALARQLDTVLVAEQPKLHEKLTEIAGLLESLGDDILPTIAALYHDALSADNDEVRRAIVAHILSQWVITENADNAFQPADEVVEIVRACLLKDKSVRVRQEAAQLIEKNPTPYLKDIPEFLEDTDSRVQKTIVAALGRYRHIQNKEIKDEGLKAEILAQFPKETLFPGARFLLAMIVIEDNGYDAKQKLAALGEAVKAITIAAKDPALHVDVSIQSLQRVTQQYSITQPQQWKEWFESNKSKLQWDAASRKFLMTDQSP